MLLPYMKNPLSTWVVSPCFPLSQRGFLAPKIRGQDGISEILSKKVYPLHQQNEPGVLGSRGEGLE